MSEAITKTAPANETALKLLAQAVFHRGRYSMDCGRTYRPAVLGAFFHIEGMVPAEVPIGLKGERTAVVGYMRKDQRVYARYSSPDPESGRWL